jgi:hypothetical protein
MSDQEFISYIGTVHSSISGSTGEYLATSISLNFESDRVALSTSNVSNYTGRVDIHDYGTSWTKIFSLSGPDGQNSSFGHEISLNWSGTRLAVSAYEVNKVYILDAIGTGSNIWSSYVSNTLNTSSLSLPGSAEFGYSISLAQDDGNRIAVGAPGQNKVYVYEYDSANNNWGSGPVWTSTDSGINNVLAYAVDSDGLATSYIHAHAISNRYGHKVRLSAFGNYLIIGAPGETNASINSTTAYYPEGTTTNYTGSYTGQHQIGHVRCYTNDGDTWASGTTQYGQNIRGKAGTAIGTDNQPSFGTSCDISTNGNKITVSSPYKKVSTLPNAGQIDTYLINDDLDTWLSVSTSIAGAKSNQKLGMNHRLDFAGERLATGDLATSTQESAYYGGISLYAFDFGTDRWYDITRPIQLHNWPTVGSNDHNPVDITNGKIIAISDPRDPPGNSYNTAGTSGKVIFYQFPLTNAIQGNTSVGGYIKCENLYVGANDNSSNTDHSIANKRISFGGTIRDNSYEETYIENRSVDGAGKSELLLYKRNDIWDKLGGGPHSTNPANMVDDSIRIKAAEICLDYEDTNLHGTYPNAAVRNTRFLLNRSGQIALGNAYYNGNFDVLPGVSLDVNDTSHFHNMINIANNINRPMNTNINVDTNSDRLFKGLGTDSELVGSGINQIIRTNVENGAWDPDYKAFYIDDTGSASFRVISHPGNWNPSSCHVSVWIRLNDTQANCAGQLVWFLYNLATGSGYNGCRCNLTATGLEFRYEENTTSNNLVANYTFNQSQWYHIGIQMPAEGNYPQNGNTILYINGTQQSLTWPGTYINTGSHSGYWDDIGYGIGAYNWYDDVYPTVELTQNSMNSYIASASSDDSDAYKAFTLEYKDSGNSTWSSSSNYTPNYTTMRSTANSGCPTTSYSGGSVLGEWIQLKLPSAESFIGVQFGCHRKKSHVADSFLGGSFYAGVILGSNDGSSWNHVNTFSGLTREGYVNHDFQNTKFGSTSSSYQYWRIVVTELCDNFTYAEIAQIGFIKSYNNMGVKNLWIARFDIGEGNYTTGKEKIIPNEMLTVGGTANITKGLTINKQIASNYELDVVGDINFTGTLYQNGTAFGGFVEPLSSVAGVYPLSAMTSNSSGPHVASASSTNPSDWPAWKAFNKVIGGEGWHSIDAYSSSTGNYSGSTSTTYNGSSTVSGEWIQLQFTTGAIATNKIEIAPRTNYLSRCAGDGILLGSNDGSTWTSIHSFSGQTYTNGQYNSIAFTTSSVYTYLRLVVTKLSGTGHQPLNISEIRYTTSVSIPGNFIYYPSTGTNKSVGINTSSPAYELDVVGDINFTGNIYQNSNLFSTWTQSGSDIYYNSGNVGVGETSPTQLIHARGTGPQLFIEGATNENAVIRGSAGPSYRDKYHEISMGFFALAGYGSSNYIDFKVNEGGQSNSPGTRMRIRGDGHVGIGTSNPSGPLHIYESTGSSHGVNTGTLILDHGDSGGSSCIMFTSRINNSSDYGYIQYEDSTSSSGDEKSRLIIGTQNDAAGGNEDNIILSPSSCVGIGTNFPTAAKVHVNGSRSLTLSYAYYNNTGSPGIGSGTNDYSIYASDRIAATEFNAFSDSRIKKNVTDINDSSALDKIRLLEPKIYNYIDEKQRGTSNVYGFIAQEVANVLPYAVTVGHGDIPNILTNSNVIVTENSNVIELHLDTPVEGLTLSNTSVINIITDKDTSIPCNVLSFSGSNVITIENRKEFSNVTGAYIHGEHVLDFHNLNKDAIWSVATAALQEVDRQLQAEKTKVATLETQVADLLARVTALENN